MFSVENLRWYHQAPLVAGFCVLLWLGLKLWRSIRERQIRIIPSTWNGVHAHQWSLIQCLTHRATCCLCRSLIVDAMFCYSCGVCLDFTCYQQLTGYFRNRRASLAADRTLGDCKAVSVALKEIEDAKEANGDGEDFTSWKHHWVQGNLPAHSRCFICDDYCDDDEDQGATSSPDLICSAQSIDDEDNHNEGREKKNNKKDNTHFGNASGDHTLHNYRCCWCQRTVHEWCYHRNQQLTTAANVRCDFGRYRRHILPPYSVIHRKVWTTKGRRAIQLEAIRQVKSDQLGGEEWQPLLVIANRRSGNADAERVLQQFLPILNPIQVIDLGQGQPLEFGLQIVKMLQPVVVRIVVAGGDGTIGWVLNTIEQMQLEPAPLVAIVPLGTGNDLSRVLGWGDGSEQIDRDHLLRLVRRARPIQLDRWNVEIRPNGYYQRSRRVLITSLHIPRSIMPAGYRNMFVYNYFSIGVDALVALNFHVARSSTLYNLLFT